MTVMRAFLVIDVQEAFRQRGNWQAGSDPGHAPPLGGPVDAPRAPGDLVVWVLHTEPGTGGVFAPDSGHVRFVDGLDPRPDEPLLRKTSRNAFTTTNLQQILTAAGIR